MERGKDRGREGETEKTKQKEKNKIILGWILLATNSYAEILIPVPKMWLLKTGPSKK